tara:strand:+ start:523 stop:1140 length:618 start_codon:yes stop_codon:yes gene_type:complete
MKSMKLILESWRGKNLNELEDPRSPSPMSYEHEGAADDFRQQIMNLVFKLAPLTLDPKTAAAVEIEIRDVLNTLNIGTDPRSKLNKEEKQKSTKKYDDHEDLKGDQDELPDGLQKAIIKKAGGDPEEEEKEKVKEAAGMSGNPKEDALRQIVADKQMGKVDGTTVDMTSANVILQVLDALNPQNREKYLNLPVKDMADIAFKMMK